MLYSSVLEYWLHIKGLQHFNSVRYAYCIKKNLHESMQIGCKNVTKYYIDRLQYLEATMMPTFVLPALLTTTNTAISHIPTPRLTDEKL